MEVYIYHQEDCFYAVYVLRLPFLLERFPEHQDVASSAKESSNVTDMDLPESPLHLHYVEMHQNLIQVLKSDSSNLPAHS